ncbi:hypothetical protein U0070_004717 [Myodes glareolus]|uniref:Uncharacterized protein n=1 Tax=Myodes glareolus TaxID=447135 RepID=A0AAW0I9M8_MYOGA
MVVSLSLTLAACLAPEMTESFLCKVPLPRRKLNHYHTGLFPLLASKPRGCVGEHWVRGNDSCLVVSKAATEKSRRKETKAGLLWFYSRFASVLSAQYKRAPSSDTSQPTQQSPPTQPTPSVLHREKSAGKVICRNNVLIFLLAFQNIANFLSLVQLMESLGRSPALAALPWICPVLSHHEVHLWSHFHVVDPMACFTALSLAAAGLLIDVPLFYGFSKPITSEDSVQGPVCTLHSPLQNHHSPGNGLQDLQTVASAFLLKFQHFLQMPPFSPAAGKHGWEDTNIPDAGVLSVTPAPVLWKGFYGTLAELSRCFPLAVLPAGRKRFRNRDVFLAQNLLEDCSMKNEVCAHSMAKTTFAQMLTRRQVTLAFARPRVFQCPVKCYHPSCSTSPYTHGCNTLDPCSGSPRWTKHHFGHVHQVREKVKSIQAEARIRTCHKAINKAISTTKPGSHCPTAKQTSSYNLKFHEANPVKLQCNKTDTI